MARSTRNQPFCWQEKKILRLFRKLFTGNELSKFRNLYGAITEMDSDFNNQDIKFYTKTISTYSGLSEDWIPKGLKKLQELKIIEIVEDRVNGKFKGKRLIFTPENIEESIVDTITQKVGNGKIANGFLESSEDISLLEDIKYKEDINTDFYKKSQYAFYDNCKHFLNSIKITDKNSICDYTEEIKFAYKTLEYFYHQFYNKLGYRITKLTAEQEKLVSEILSKNLDSFAHEKFGYYWVDLYLSEKRSKNHKDKDKKYYSLIQFIKGMNFDSMTARANCSGLDDEEFKLIKQIS